MTKPTTTRQPPKTGERKPATSGQTHAEFLQSLRDAHAAARPVSFFRQWPAEYLREAGLPQDWLEKCGLIQPEGAAKIPTQCSQRAFAALVTRLYGKPINQAAVSRAIKDGLKACVTASNGRLRTDAALRWWEINRAGVGGSAVASEAEDKAARQRIARQRDEIELAELERKISDKWILRETATFTFCRAFREHHFFAKRLLEKHLANDVENFAKALDIAPQKIEALKSYVRELGRKIIDEIEDEAVRRASGCDSTLDELKTEKL
jgi:hypothetical protein